MPRPISGRIPLGGTSQSASFARRRAQQYLNAARSSNPALVLAIPRSSERFIPARQVISGPRFRDSAGKFHPMTGSRIHQEPPSGQSVGGFRAYPRFGLLPSITAGAQVRLGTRFDRFGKKTQLVDIRGFKYLLNRILAITGIPHIGARFVIWHVGRWCLMEMVYLTPVDTGQAAAAWSISPQLRGAGTGYGKVGFRIKNPLSYVVALEYGWSDQAPEGMQRVTFARARMELRNLLDTLIAFWEKQQYHLRGFHFDTDFAGGVPYRPEKIEKEIPRYVWQQLANELQARLPLDKPIAHLNADAFLAMRVSDPKDWHTVHDFEESEFIFESTVRTKHGGKDFFGKTTITREVTHVYKSSLEREAKKLEEAWGRF